ncbi:hypothetical protein METHB2_330006 [Candidatus Methylobacter favarea]|uniref:Uncharacterized protein n=1 Tax=Candidatus Methylobacter favarea TaxID=2707345 RepID=A0A8S0Y6D0_9GAMM|nr:hypothetical protein METHB2_330006 [Candidatus Methylobacter favarea]
MIGEIPLQYLAKLCALFRNRVMPAPMQVLPDFPQRRLHPITTHQTLERKPAAPGAATDVREPQEVERLRLAPLLVRRVVSPHGVRTRSTGSSAGAPRQFELLYALLHLGEEPFGIGSMLEPDDGIIGVTNDNHVPVRLTASPPVRPEVEDGVQIDVGQQRGDDRSLGRARCRLCHSALFQDSGLSPLANQP